MKAARFLPVTALASVVVIAVTLRVTRPVRVAPIVAPAAAEAPARSGYVADVPDASVPSGPAHALHGDARRAHRAAVAGPTTADKIAWRTDVGGPVVAQVTASPDGRTLYAATIAGALVALDRESGRIVFRVDLGGRAYGTPVVRADGSIVVGSDAKTLLAIGPAGDVRARVELGEEIDTSPVLTAGGDVVVAAGPTLASLRPTLDVRWRYRARGKIFTSPAETGALLVVGSQDDHVHAVDASGKLAWKVDLGADVDGAPAVDDDGAIVVGTDAGEVVRLDASGQVLARTKVGGFVRGPLAIARNGDAVVGTYGPAPRLVRVTRTGTLAFELAVPGTGSPEHGIHGGALEDATGTLFFGAQDDRVRAVARDGTVRFTYVAKADVDAPLTLLDGGGLVVPCDDGTVTLLLP